MKNVVAMLIRYETILISEILRLFIGRSPRQL
jgi:hypothetical protein